MRNVILNELLKKELYMSAKLCTVSKIEEVQPVFSDMKELLSWVANNNPARLKHVSPLAQISGRDPVKTPEYWLYLRGSIQRYLKGYDNDERGAFQFCRLLERGKQEGLPEDPVAICAKHFRRSKRTIFRWLDGIESELEHVFRQAGDLPRLDN